MSEQNTEGTEQNRNLLEPKEAVERQDEVCVLEPEELRELDRELAEIAEAGRGFNRLSLPQFLRNCNDKRSTFEITPRWSNSHLRPNAIEVRFDAPRYRRYYSARRWWTLNDGLAQLSQGVLQITTSEELYLNGIIDIAVATRSPAYREYTLIRALQWLVKQITN